MPKQKLHLTKFEAKITLFKSTAIGMQSQTQYELNAAENKGLLWAKSTGILGWVCWLSWPKGKVNFLWQKIPLLQLVASVQELDLSYPRDWKIGVIFTLLITFQRDGPEILKEDIPGL